MERRQAGAQRPRRVGRKTGRAAGLAGAPQRASGGEGGVGRKGEQVKQARSDRESPGNYDWVLRGFLAGAVGELRRWR